MIDINYLKEILSKIIRVDSPSGFCQNIRKILKQELSILGYDSTENKKGNVMVEIRGKTNYTIGLSAHVDTLGAIVKSINSSGTLEFSSIGSPQLPTLDGEYCTIYTRCNKIYTGTFLSSSPSSHVYSDFSTKPRTEQNMEVRLDEKVTSRADTLELGIYNGDYICIDPKFVITEKNFIKSRFLDDKISVAILLTYLKYLKEYKIVLNSSLVFVFSTYEEVGHGGSHMPLMDELIAIDMACVGSSLDGNESKVSICAKDSSGPYDYDMISELSDICKKNKLDYAIDIYPYYGSDASSSLRAGNDIKVALIGPGVHASHGMERTHLDGVLNTLNLLIKYLER